MSLHCHFNLFRDILLDTIEKCSVHVMDVKSATGSEYITLLFKMLSLKRFIKVNGKPFEKPVMNYGDIGFYSRDMFPLEKFRKIMQRVPK